MLPPDWVLSTMQAGGDVPNCDRVTIANMAGLGWTRKQVSAFRAALAGWYRVRRRDLPWRRDIEPYRVWISEIMLQQTRVAAVVPYYERFLRRFPTVLHLARARESSVLAAWSGLGYYRRARMLHRAAREIARERGGVFPRTLDGWLALPGIGPYTAAAISSIVLDLPAAVVDGNVERVLGRMTGRVPTRKNSTQLAGELLDPSHPGDHNQAMMELGATVCLPKSPQCGECPVIQLCATRGAGAAGEKPVRQRREVAYALARRNGSVLLVQRATDANLMAGMWELPSLPVIPDVSPLLRVRHSITITDYTVSVYERPRMATRNGRWVSLRTLSRLPLTGLARKVLRGVDALI
jgi:A/G-specific adenine glycosylase